MSFKDSNTTSKKHRAHCGRIISDICSYSYGCGNGCPCHRFRSFTNYVDKILAFLDHLLPCVDMQVQPTYSFDSFMYLKSNVVTKKGLPVAVISSCALIHFWDFVSPLRLFLFNYYILYRSREHYFNRTIWHFKFTKSRLLLKTQSLIWNPLISRYLPITYASFQNNQSW